MAYPTLCHQLHGIVQVGGLGTDSVPRTQWVVSISQTQLANSLRATNPMRHLSLCHKLSESSHSASRTQCVVSMQLANSLRATNPMRHLSLCHKLGESSNSASRTQCVVSISQMQLAKSLCATNPMRHLNLYHKLSESSNSASRTLWNCFRLGCWAPTLCHGLLSNCSPR